MVERRKNLKLLVLCLVVIVLATIMSYAIERDFGKVVVTPVKLVDESGAGIAGILFRPKVATAENKMPGILNLHGLLTTNGPRILSRSNWRDAGLCVGDRYLRSW